MNKKEIYACTGNAKQLYGIQQVTINEGGAIGSRLLHVYTAAGLEADILPDAGMDIGLVRYKGVNMSYISKNGYDCASTFLPYEQEFMNTFPGGMLYTCGLRSVGTANRDNDEWHPLHGRLHGQSAEQVSAVISDEKIVISGKLKESALFGHLLTLTRTITIPVWGSDITIEDTIENLTPNSQEFMLLYHFNIGYPMLSRHTQLYLPNVKHTLARTAEMERHINDCMVFTDPVDNYPEQVFFHLCEKGEAVVKNTHLNIEIRLNYSLDSLPVLAQWKSMNSGDYVLGLEPSNCYILGRNAERENKTLKQIEPFETVSTKTKLCFARVVQEGEK